MEVLPSNYQWKRTFSAVNFEPNFPCKRFRAEQSSPNHPANVNSAFQPPFPPICSTFSPKRKRVEDETQVHSTLTISQKVPSPISQNLPLSLSGKRKLNLNSPMESKRTCTDSYPVAQNFEYDDLPSFSPLYAEKLLPPLYVASPMNAIVPYQSVSSFMQQIST